MMELLEKVYEDLVKAVEKENKAAAQRVRTGSIRLEKVAKLFRKESVKEMPKKKRATKSLQKKNFLLITHHLIMMRLCVLINGLNTKKILNKH